MHTSIRTSQLICTCLDHLTKTVVLSYTNDRNSLADAHHPCVRVTNELGKHKCYLDIGGKILSASNYVDKHLVALEETSYALKDMSESRTFSLPQIQECLIVYAQHKPEICVPNALKSLEEPLTACLEYVAGNACFNDAKIKGVFCDV